MNVIEILESKIKVLEKEKMEIINLLYFGDITDTLKKTELINKYISLKNKIDIRKDELYNALINRRQPNLSDGRIDLYKSTNNKGINYIIKLCNVDECIGFIDYRKEYKDVLGNIGYGIKSEYRGNNYTLSALKLVSDDLLHEGVEDVIITANKDNIPSIKIIENFGGVLINIEGDVLIYKCVLNKKKVIK